MPDNTSSNDGGLQLAYTFRSVPNPIRASPSGLELWLIDLHVTISNPGTDPIAMVSIGITFPLGQDIDADLSGDPQLPAPTLETPGAWQVQANKEKNGVHVQAAGAGTIEFAGNPLIFIVPGIRVNTKPGKVVLAIAEKPTKFDQNIGEALLEKLESDFPVSSFSADPDGLGDLEQRVKLKWSATEEGRKRSYKVRSANWNNDNRAYDWMAGPTGVPTPRLRESTTFFLDVARSEGGDAVLQKTLSTFVNVTPVSLKPTYHVAASPTGRVLKLGWLASNAIRCMVVVDGEIADATAPADTYLEEDRYFLFLTGPVGSLPRIEIVAVGIGDSRASLLIAGTIPLREPIPLRTDFGGGFMKAVITPDEQSAFLMPMYSQKADLVLVNLAKPQAQPVTLPDPANNWPSDVALSPQGHLALFTNGSTVVYVDVAGKHIIGRFEYPEFSLLGAIAITPDGRTALVHEIGRATISASGSQIVSWVHFIDIASKTLRHSIPAPPPMAVANGDLLVTSDARKALLSRGGEVHFIDLTGVEPFFEAQAVINTGMAWGMAMSPDEKLVVVGESTSDGRWDFGSARIVSMASREAEPVMGTPGAGMAFTPDGRLFVTCGDKSTTVLDVASRTSRTCPITGRAIAFSRKPMAVFAGIDACIV